MRSMVLWAFIFGLAATLPASGSQRMVLIEMQTNTGCPGCKAADSVLDQMIAAHPNEFIAVRYHAWWPSSSDPFYMFNPSENSARIRYYPPHTDGYRYMPYAWIDGVVRGGYNYASWWSMIQNRRLVSSPLEINLSGVYFQLSRSGTLVIRIVATGTVGLDSLFVRTALIQNGIYYQAPNGSLWHHQTMRDMIPDTLGLRRTLVQGDTIEISLPFSVSSQLVWQNCELVVWVQSDRTREILQSAKIGLPAILYDLTAFRLESPFNRSNIRNCYPVFCWHPSFDTTMGGQVSYRVYWSLSPSFTNPFITDSTFDTTLQSPVCLYYDSTYYWKVLAFTGTGASRFSEDTYQLTIRHPCEYTPGDINGDGNVLGSDVTFGVRYFKGIGANPPDSCYDDSLPGNHFLYIAGDVNDDCQFRGSDITRLVAYFKGLTNLLYCHLTPPSGTPRMSRRGHATPDR